MYEVRYQGRLVGRFDTEGQAKGYRKERIDHPVEGPAFDKKALTVEPGRPFELYANGSLVDTFSSSDDANSELARLRDEEKRGVSPLRGPGAVLEVRAAQKG